MTPTPRRRVDSTSSLSDALEAWLFQIGAAKPSPATVAAYRRDVEGVGGRLAQQLGRSSVVEVTVDDLDRRSLQAAFSSWASDHAAASVRRAHAAWTGLLRFLVSEAALGTNPMESVTKPKAPSTLPRSIRAPDAVSRLLSVASEPDATARDPWPSRDLALVATFCVTGVREAEAAALSMGSFAGDRGARRLEVLGKGSKMRAVPVDPALESVVDRYLFDRRKRFPKDRVDHPGTPLFVDVRGRRMTVHQIHYLISKLYVRAGVRASVPPGAMVHALRHTFATAALEAGADVVELQELLGHSSLETTRRYLSATAQGLRHVIAAHPSQAALRNLGATQESRREVVSVSSQRE